MKKNHKVPQQPGSPCQFQEVASIYDDLMTGISYDIWVRYIKDLWRRRGINPQTILDVACGTGNVSFRLADFGYQVVGIDYSQPMIDVAHSKLTCCSHQQHLESCNPRFYCQDASDFTLQETFDSAISLFDSLNYITDYKKLCSVFNRVFRHLNSGGIFIFDVNTIYALSEGFFDQDNLQSGRYPRYVWTSRWDEETRLCTIEMDFEMLGEGEVRQFHEVHLQRGYTKTELEKGLLEAGFVDIEMFQAYTFRKPSRRSDRLYLISRRPGSE